MSTENKNPHRAATRWGVRRKTMNRRKTHKTDYSPLPYIVLVFLLGIVAGLLLSMAHSGEAEEVISAPIVAIDEPVPVVPLDEPEEPKQPELESIGLYQITAYCPCERCCGKWADGITATGTEATEGRTIAVDPAIIALGSVVYFEGVDGLIGGHVAEDTGGAIKGNRIDVYFESHSEALAWGVREMEVFTVK